MKRATVQIDSRTLIELERLAAEIGTTVEDAVTVAVRALWQSRIGADLSTPLTEAETAWLEADLG